VRGPPDTQTDGQPSMGQHAHERVDAEAAVRSTLVTLLRKTPRYRAFRPTSFASWSVERFADALKGPGLVTPDVMQAALIALHVHDRSAMLAAFLDSVGVPHTDGVIGELPASLTVSQDALERAADELAGRFPREDVTLYFLTLIVLEPELWGGLAAWIGWAVR
jgi:hypothetical protein